MDFVQIVEESLAQPSNALLYHLSTRLQRAFPERYLLETDSWAFNLRGFQRDGQCVAQTKPESLPQWSWQWNDKRKSSYADVRMACFEVEWQEKTFDALAVTYGGRHGDQTRWYVLGPTQADTRALFEAVAEWTAEVRGEVLVFDGGCWRKDKDLFESIQGSSWDNLVLEGGLKEEIRTDLDTFFESKDLYTRYGIPWKRGVLFLGPPGNGKTHAIKAIVGSIGHPCLYVKSFDAEYRTAHDLIGEVFSRARATAPCVLVLEDLDALVNDENRSFFLNELDGFASNEGILAVATTNHPERLDPAILERPSRFDRKYTFGLPEPVERAEYLRLFSERLEPDLQLDAPGIEAVTRATEGYSFAYLKELYLSAMMRWIAHPGKQPIADLMTEQSELLRSQMTTDPANEPPPKPKRGAYSAAAMQAYMNRWKK